jgi:protein SCO1/2
VSRVLRRPDRRARDTATALVLLAATLAACSSTDRQSDSAASLQTRDEDGYHGTLVDPPLTIAPVTLTDTSGSRVRPDSLLPGKATAFFFGFTNCDDVCPTTMADLAAAKRTLPARYADDVSLVFITVDPQRDTRPVLRSWLDRFNAEIVGLRGPVARVHRAEDSLYASQSGRSKMPSSSDAPGEHEHGDEHVDDHGYEVDHSSVVYLFGPDGQSVIYTGGAIPADYADDFVRLLDEG